MNRNLVLSMLALAVLALPACGGSGGSSDEDQIRQVVTESAKTPAKLCEDLAAAPLKAIGGKAKCTQLAKGQKGADVKIGTVAVKGDTAIVKAAGAGSGTGDIKLVKEDGDWKISLES
ncbi:MAG: hypothetical protein JWQ18_2811 [Conexibacter sp.]|nr:hypothetical protein [Conexibacter sp.]